MGAQGSIVYTIDGKNVYFSGITLPHVATSTINAAERIIALICEAERTEPSRVIFFDIQTNRGYSAKEPSSFAIDRLRLVYSDGSYSVAQWIPVEMSDDLLRQGIAGIHNRDQLPGVPQSIMEIFRPYMYE